MSNEVPLTPIPRRLQDRCANVHSATWGKGRQSRLLRGEEPDRNTHEWNGRSPLEHEDLETKMESSATSPDAGAGLTDSQAAYEAPDMNTTLIAGALAGKKRSFTFREDAAFMIRNSAFGRAIGFIVSIASILSIILYVVASYVIDDDDGIHQDHETVLIWIDFAFDSLFLVDYIFFLYISDDRIAHIILPTSIADFLSVLPILSIVVSDIQVLAIFRFFRCVRILKLYRLHGTVEDVTNRTQRQIVMLLFSTMAFLFVSAGVIHACDVLANGGQYEGVENEIAFHEAFYFLVVTITTVGYGDISPKTDGSRMLLVCIILCGFGLLPRQVAKLNEVVREHSTYIRCFKPHNKTWRHVVLVGPPTPTGISADTVRTILKGFMHQDRGDIKMHVVILSPFEPAPEILMLLQHRVYELRLTYVKGSVMDDDAMVRAKADSAQAFFVCVNKYDSVQLMHEEDMEAILSTLAIKRYRDTMGVIVELNSEVSKSWLEAYSLPAVQIVCLEELRNGLLAHSCLYPGLSTLLMNMVQTYEGGNDSHEHGSNEHVQEMQKMEKLLPWEQQYLWGARQQLYEVNISCVSGLPFCVACGLLMSKFQLLLIAVQEKATKKVWRNPGNLYVIRKDDIGYVLSHTRISHSILEELPMVHSEDFVECVENARARAVQVRQRSIERVTSETLQSFATPPSSSAHRMRKSNSVERLKDLEKSMSEPQVTSAPQPNQLASPAEAAPAEVHPEAPVDSHLPSPFSLDEMDVSPRTKSIGVPPSTFRRKTGSPRSSPGNSKPSSPQITAVKSAVRSTEHNNLSWSMAQEHHMKQLELVGHIVVFGSIHGSSSFIEPLRVKQSRYEDMNKLKPIVIVSPEDDIDEINEVLGPYYFVFHITGSPLDTSVLDRAAVSQAGRVVILRDSSMSQRYGRLHDAETKTLPMDHLPIIDAENAFCYRQVLQMCGRNDLPIIELIHIPNMRFLSMNQLKCPRNDKYYQWPLYTAGQVVCTATFNALFTHFFFFPGMLEMFSAMAHKSRIPESRCYHVHDSGFICVAVPSWFCQRPYWEFFHHCIREHEAICLGLYRVANTRPYHPFVFTNPHQSEKIQDGDMAFFLAPPGFSLDHRESSLPGTPEMDPHESPTSRESGDSSIEPLPPPAREMATDDAASNKPPF